MAKTLPLYKNLPDALHARLAAAAKRHRRSLTEVIVCLERGRGICMAPAAQEALERLKAQRGRKGSHEFDPDAIDAFKREGRP